MDDWLRRYLALAERLRGTCQRLALPRPGEWLAEHVEPGQTFLEYVRSVQRPRVSPGQKLYLQPIGTFTPGQQEAVRQTADFLLRCYGFRIELLNPLPVDMISPAAQRRIPHGNAPQVLTSHLINDILRPRRPSDAVGLLGLTSLDLWPGQGWNFVFGQASLAERVGVWSLFRYGDPDRDEESFRQFLRRTLKVASHETGHLLGLAHCIAYRCGMNGSNSLEEMDRRPLAFCAECEPKVWWTCGVDPLQRYESLIAFADSRGLHEEASQWKRMLQAVLQAPASTSAPPSPSGH
jgi:archaemetzincin